MLKKIRTFIIIISVLFLFPHILGIVIGIFTPELSKETRERLAASDVNSYSLDEEIDFEHRSFHVKTLSLYDDSTFVHINSSNNLRGGWSFGGENMILIDDKGNEAAFSSSSSTYLGYKAVHRLSFEPLSKETEYVVVRVERYDRFVEEKILLMKGDGDYGS